MSATVPRALALLLLAPVAPLAAVEEAQEKAASDSSEQRFWLENAVAEHGFSDEEAAAALGVSAAELARLRERHSTVRGTPQPGADRIKVLPYPGGRHPRNGFLDGAVDPHRDTKASVFLPWKDSGYVVVDLPEAMWFRVEDTPELLYLAHTHIPTIWDKREVSLERSEWTREKDGALSARRRFPNGAEFAARVVPQKEWVDMELRLTNGTSAEMTGLRTQICVLLKGAPAFAAQTNDNKELLQETVACRSVDGNRWIVTVWDRARPWANPPCPCMHADPVFPDLAPGTSATVRGRIFFFEGEDVAAEVERRRRAATLNGTAPGTTAGEEKEDAAAED
jgi:hypothetical protein